MTNGIQEHSDQPKPTATKSPKPKRKPATARVTIRRSGTATTKRR